MSTANEAVFSRHAVQQASAMRRYMSQARRVLGLAIFVGGTLILGGELVAEPIAAPSGQATVQLASSDAP